ncbi:MAG: hypothetical protein P4L65_03300 [Legionella sp.]|nr:hypothetical protein [Legionella sp.]
MAKLHKEYLLDARIDSDKNGTLSERLDYAWKVYNSPLQKYALKHKLGAYEFFRRTFKSLSDEQISILMRLKEENPNKQKDYIPDVNDLDIFLVMLPIDYVKALVNPLDTKQKDFVSVVNLRIDELNLLFNAYNNAESIAQKKTLMSQINSKQKAILSEFPPIVAKKYPDYIEKIQRQLFTDIQLHCSRLGVCPLQGQAPYMTLESSSTSSLAEILATMPPQKIDELARVLSDESTDEKPYSLDVKAFKELYKKGEPGYDKYQSFLATHAISFLGGTNSRNFKITPIGGESFVLKIENRLTAPKLIELELKNSVSLSEAFIWSTAERQASFMNKNGQPEMRTLMTMPFCKGSDLDHHASNEMLQAERVCMALSIYTQMATILGQMYKEGFAFPDMKNSNWLLDSTGKLRIADTKSISFTDAKGALDYHTPKNYWYGGERKEPITTACMRPPEFFVYIGQLKSSAPKPFSCSADKMHSFMFGLNLYKYLTQCNDQFLKEVVTGKQPLNFSGEIFTKSSQGEALREFIKDLTVSDPTQRMSLDDGLTRLKEITASANPTALFRDRLNKIISVSDNKPDALVQPNMS